MKKYFKKLLLLLAALLIAPVTYAEEVTEGFESVSIVDADGNAVAATAFGVGLSNGWKVIGGQIYADDYSSDYGFSETAKTGRKALVGVSSSNSAIMVIPVPLTGKISFYARQVGTSSSTRAYVDLFEMEQDGSSFKAKSSSSFKYWRMTTSYTKYEYDLGENVKYVGIRLQKTLLDDIVYNTVSLEPHEHDYASEWSMDENEHWHACTSEVGICDAKKIDVAAHDGLTCSVCGYKTPGIESFPWLEDFNGISSGIPAGWDNSEGTTTTASYKWNYYSKSVRFDSFNNSNGNTNVLATPYILIPSTGVYELKFRVKNPKGGNYEVKIAEYGSAERTTLFDNLTNLADWTEKTASLEAYAGKAVKIYFCGTSNYGSGDAYLYLDDVTVKESIAHNHNYSEEWSHDYNNHWHACTSEIGECDAPQADFAAHTLNADGICTVCGYDQPYREDFENGIPASWTNKGWTIKDNPDYGNGTKMAFAGTGYSAASNTLVSPKLSAKAGDVLEFEALQLWNDEYLTMEYSTDMGETWTQAIHVVPAANNTLHTLQFTAPAAGVYQLRFSGAYNYIDNICGFKLAQIPVMEVTTTGGATKEGDVFTDNFGRQTANASHTYTVKNTGAGTLVVNIASENADFTISEATLEMAAGESKTFDVTFVHSNSYGAKDAAITIVPTYEGLATVTINASANCADPEAFFEDFENGMPATWKNTGWTIKTQNGSKMAYSNTSDDYKLTTPILAASKDDVLTFDAFQQWNDEPLKLEYSTDGINWITAFEEAPAADNKARQFSFTAPEAGYYLLRFSGSYNYIDNVAGFKLAPANVLGASSLTIKSDVQYATMCYPADVTLPEGVTAYIATQVKENSIHLEPLETSSTVPAYEPVILYSETEKTVQLSLAVNDRAEEIISGKNGNILKGCTAPTLIENGANTFCLSKKSDVVGFYPLSNGLTIPAFRAFLQLEGGSASISGLRIIVDGESATGIQALPEANEARPTVIYNLSGQRITKMQRGINIINGKKVLY